MNDLWVSPWKASCWTRDSREDSSCWTHWYPAVTSPNGPCRYVGDLYVGMTGHYMNTPVILHIPIDCPNLCQQYIFGMNINEYEWMWVNLDYHGLIRVTIYIYYVYLFIYVCIMHLNIYRSMTEYEWAWIFPWFSHDFLQHVWVSPGPPGPDSPRRNSGHAGPVRGQTGASVQAIGAWDARTGRRVPPRRSGGVS